MSKEKTACTEIYLLPLFVDNLRKALDQTQESLQEAYVSLLRKDIHFYADELLNELERKINSGNNGVYNDLRLSSASSNKKTLVLFYFELRNDIELIAQQSLTISQALYCKIANAIEKRLAFFDECLARGSGGGIEVRSIRKFFNYKAKPQNKTIAALKYVLIRLIPMLFYEIEPRLASIFLKSILATRESIIENLLSIDGHPIDDAVLLDDIVNKLMLGKALCERTKRDKISLGDSVRANQLDAFTTLFTDILTCFEENWVVTHSEHRPPEGFINELNDHYGIGAAFARNILFGLSGAEFEIAKQKWGEISESVYHLVRIAEDQSAELYYRSNPRVEMMSIETLFITEFLLLFFSDKKIRTVMNELPFMNITRMEVVGNE